MFYSFFHLVFFIIATVFFGMRIHGHRNIPRTGPVILAPNHVSYFDPAIAGTAMWRRVRYAAREELFDSWFGNLWLRGVQAFPISRDVMTKGALRQMLSFLERGEVVLIFPEGTRGTGRELLDPKPGIGMVAHLSRAPVVPVYLKGTSEAFPRGARQWRYRPISVHYGKPIDLSHLYDLPKYRGIYLEVSREIMNHLRAMKDKYDPG